MPSQRRTLHNEVMEGREEEVGREPQHGRMHRSRVTLFIVATCLRLFQEEDVSSQGRTPLFSSSTAGSLLLPRGSSDLLLACVEQFLLFVSARSHRRSSAADSGLVSTSFCMFLVSFFFFFFSQVQVQHFLCGLALTPKRSQIRTCLRSHVRALLSHIQQKGGGAVPQCHTLLAPGLFV